jgi:hypothetical protein
MSNVTSKAVNLEAPVLTISLTGNYKARKLRGGRTKFYEYPSLGLELINPLATEFFFKF